MVPNNIATTTDFESNIFHINNFFEITNNVQKNEMNRFFQENFNFDLRILETYVHTPEYRMQIQEQLLTFWHKINKFNLKLIFGKALNAIVMRSHTDLQIKNIKGKRVAQTIAVLDYLKLFNNKLHFVRKVDIELGQLWCANGNLRIAKAVHDLENNRLTPEIMENILRDKKFVQSQNPALRDTCTDMIIHTLVHEMGHALVYYFSDHDRAIRLALEETAIKHGEKPMPPRHGPIADEFSWSYKINSFFQNLFGEKEKVEDYSVHQFFLRNVTEQLYSLNIFEQKVSSLQEFNTIAKLIGGVTAQRNIDELFAEAFTKWVYMDDNMPIVLETSLDKIILRTFFEETFQAKIAETSSENLNSIAIPLDRVKEFKYLTEALALESVVTTSPHSRLGL